MNQSRSQKEPMSRKAKLYWAIGIVIVILVAALLIWHNFFYGNKNAVVATVVTMSTPPPRWPTTITRCQQLHFPGTAVLPAWHGHGV